MLSPTEKWLKDGAFFAYQNFNIFYNQFGKGDDLLVIHGYPFSSYEWKDVIPELSTKFRVTVIDMLGFGFSDKPKSHRYSFEEYVSILTSLSEYLGIKSAHIICHDLGVSIIQELIKKNLEQGILLKINSVCFVNGNLFSDVYHPRLIQRLLSQTPNFIGKILSKYISKKSVYVAICELYGSFTKPDKDYFDELWEILNFNDGKSISYLLGRLVFEKAKYQDSWIEAMKKADTPFCYLCGPADPNSGISMALSFKRKLPNKHVLWMPEHIGHWPMIEDPVSFLEKYFEWLTEISSKKFVNK